jgi:cytochrome P450
VLWTCDADVIQQIYKRPQDFCKPVADMRMLNIHGPTVTGTEGEESRRYRRITTEAFGNRTYKETWRESIVQAGQMFGRLKALQDKRLLSRELERLTLNVVSQVCFGRDAEKEYAEGHAQYNGSILLKFLGKPMSNGRMKKKHQMTYHEAFGTSADHMGSIYLMPRLLLSKKHPAPPLSYATDMASELSPLPIHRRAWRSFLEWRWYMEEMVEKHQEYRRLNKGNEKRNLLGKLEANSHRT